MNNPPELAYDTLEPGFGPKFGVTDSQSSSFHAAARRTFAWFNSLEHAKQFSSNRLCKVWDLELGVKV